MKNTIRCISLLCGGLMALSLAACSPAAQPAQPSAVSTASGSSYAGRWRWRQNKKYTQADYDLAMSFQVDGYREMSVDAFDRSVLNWEDEEAYHKNEEVLERLFSSLSNEDPNADFILETLGITWSECEKKHYNACARSEAPWYSGWATYETYGDVFGDPLLLTGAYADFDFNYQVPDGAALTVGKREELLQSVQKALEQFLAEQAPAQLGQEEAMEKTLQKELEKVLKKLDGGIVWDGGAELSYHYEDLHAEEQEYSGTAIADGTEQSRYDHYTKQQYAQALDALQFEGYQQMSVAEFNRRVNAAFAQGDEWDDSLNLAYEMLRMYLEDTDPNAAFFRTTVEASIEEYSAKMQEMYAGKQIDPAWSGHIDTDIKEDVFGDEVIAGGVAGDYILTYRILDADALTVAERDAFLQAVDDGVQNFIQQAAKNRKGTEAEFKAAVEAAGKAAGNAKIRFTGCEVGYFEVY